LVFWLPLREFQLLHYLMAVDVGGLDPAGLHVYVRGEMLKPLTHEVVAASDIVISLGCWDACPVLPGRSYYDWALPDLKGLDIESARSVRDTLTRRVEKLAEELRCRAVA
jgi:hypothetical protein